MLLGVIADDFTGAGDIANTLAKGLPGRGGLDVRQYLGVPSRPALAEVEAGVISLKSRSIPAAQAVTQSLAALEWLRAQGCRQFVFKYCSTFDSTPDGNIGPVCEALADALGVKGVVVCPAFPTLGRTVHQGHLFVNDRLLNESGMERHPLTPMTDPDIRRWLARQTRGPVGLAPCAVVRAGPDAVREALVAAAGRSETLVVTDAATDDDLVALGHACRDARLVTGGSGIALGLPQNFIDSGEASGRQAPFRGIDGPEAVLAGSCSSATRGQIRRHKESHPTLALDVDAVMAGAFGVGEVVTFLRGHEGCAPLVYSSDDPEAVSQAQARHGRERLAATLDALFADTARALVAGGARRIVVAGGETSGAVAQALGFGSLKIGPEIDPGVPILTDEDATVAVALKSGNFGGPDFFEKALRALRAK